MRRLAYALTVVTVIALAACGGGKKRVVATPPPPVAPATPPPAPPPSTTRDVAPQVDDYARLRQMASTEIEQLGILTDIHFEFDKFDIRDEDRQVLAKNADALRKYDFLKITVEGHCDERGTEDYNMNLGERRAKAALDYLVSLGVPADRLKNVSYGKEVPLCQEHTEDCWARNRRAHFAVTGKTAGRGTTR